MALSDIRRNLEQVRSTLKDDVILVAVTKTHSYNEINEAIECGVTDIGENKVQEILDKYEHVKPVRWHMIGHLQTNKVRHIIDKVDLIHSVDSMKLAREIDRRAGEHGRIMDILVQVNPAEEESKFGVSCDEADRLVMDILSECDNIRVRGLMSVAPYAENPEDVRKYFAEVKKIYDRLGKVEHENLELSWLSMGMSNDYQVAMEEGSNMVRVGSAIFGRRTY